MKLYVIAGHGAGDPGACAGGCREADLVRSLAQRIKDLGGGAVTLHPTDDDAYRSGALNGLEVPEGTCVVELHMDSASANARGGHVIIKGGLSPDAYDSALASLMADMFPGRSSLIVKRNDLANVNRAARRGINYRLVENGFISNVGDLETFNSRLDDLARGYLSAFGIAAGEAPAASKPAQKPAAASKASSIDVDGYWGPSTVKAVQRALGTSVDGVVSGQDSRDMSAIGGRPSDAWKIGKGGSQMVKALQKKLGVSADGYFGPNTLKALQKAMGTTADGVLSRPSACVREMQRRLNSDKF